MNYSYKTIREKMKDKYHDFNNIGYFVRVPTLRLIPEYTYSALKNSGGTLINTDGIKITCAFNSQILRLYNYNKNEDWELRNLTEDGEYSIYGITNFSYYSKYHKQLLKETFLDEHANKIITDAIIEIHEKYLRNKLLKVI